MYIAFEGIDTCGKTTQIELLKKEFPNFIYTKEPGGTPVGSKIRDILLHDKVSNPITEMLLFLADRSEHKTNIVIPNRDNDIISDRSLVSGIAYGMENIPIKDLLMFHRYVLKDSVPDYIILLLLKEEDIRKRLANKRSLDTIESKGVNFLLEVQERLLNVILELDLPYMWFDGSEPVDLLRHKIKKLITGLLIESQ